MNYLYYSILHVTGSISPSLICWASFTSIIRIVFYQLFEKVRLIPIIITWHKEVSSYLDTPYDCKIFYSLEQVNIFTAAPLMSAYGYIKHHFIHHMDSTTIYMHITNFILSLYHIDIIYRHVKLIDMPELLCRLYHSIFILSLNTLSHQDSGYPESYL